jgi:leucyl aminopeptidase
MGLIIGVGKGSHNEPCLIEARYEGNPTSNNWIALVGKGVCFDSGGHDIKTGGHMLGMHKDMSGGAAVVAIISALAELKVKANVVAVVPTVENMVSSHSYKPGDILTSMSGKTVEIGNTDAEGRLILADGLTYAQQKFTLSHLFEASTLTGAVSVAVGEKYSGTFTMHDDLARLFEQHGKSCGEEVWRLPVSEDFTVELKKNSHADLANIPLNDSKWGRASHAAAFLHAFVDYKKIPFIHVDIASRMDSIAEDNLAQGATGVPVRLFVRVIEDIASSTP